MCDFFDDVEDRGEHFYILDKSNGGKILWISQNQHIIANWRIQLKIQETKYNRTAIIKQKESQLR